MSEEMQESSTIESMSDSIASSLFADRDTSVEVDDGLDAAVDAASDEQAEIKEPATKEPVIKEQTASEIPATRKPPQSWKADMHEKYVSLPPEVQDYIELREKQMGEGIDRHNNDTKLGMAMRDALTPFRQEFEKYGLDETTAVRNLLNAQHRLTNGTQEQRISAYRELGKNLGFTSEPAQEQNTDPVVNQLRDELSGIKTFINQSQQKAEAEARSKIEQEVSEFASSKDHPYFEEVTKEVIEMITAGYDLKTAYDKAVWANPVTREKEILRIRDEQDKALREKNKQEAEAAKKLRSINVNSRDTKKTPTGPTGTMRNLDDALKDTMREISSKTH